MDWDIKYPPVRLHDYFAAIANPFMPVYLIIDEMPSAFDAGMSFGGPFILQSLKEFLGTEPLKRLSITHVHYDHCGSVPFLKRKIPELQIGVSEYGAELLKKEKVIEHIKKLNEEVKKQAEKYGIKSQEDTTFQPFEPDIIYRDGDTFSTGSLTVKVLEVPGHTKCSLAYFVEELGALIAGEAAGVPFMDGEIQPEFLSSYHNYVHSLKKMSELEPQMICLAHGGVITGKKAALYMQESLKATEKFAEKVVALLKKYGDEEKVAEEIAKEEYLPTRTTQPKTAYMLNLRAKIKCVQKELIAS